MSKVFVIDLKGNSLKCSLCGSLDTRNIKEYDEEDRIIDSWWRCLSCKKDYGAENQFYKLPDGTMKIKVNILWKKDA